MHVSLGMNFRLVASLGAFLVCFFGIVAVALGSPKENPRLDTWLRSCQNETGASEDDFLIIKSRKIPTSKEGKLGMASNLKQPPLEKLLFKKIGNFKPGRDF